MTAYADKLRDPRWQQVRLKVMERDEWKCVWCGCKTETLNVHHGAYQRGLAPWEYPPDHLWTLCHSCHEKVGAVMDQINSDIAQFRPGHSLLTLMVAINDLKWKHTPLPETPAEVATVP